MLSKSDIYNGAAVGQLDQAATWLLENAESTFGRSKADSGSGYHSAPPLSGVEVKAESVCICFIDDCLDCDVPLAELTFSREIILHFQWKIFLIILQESVYHIIISFMSIHLK